MFELPRWSRTHAEKPTKTGMIRVDLRRSLKMHRQLALWAALATAGVGSIYLYTSWTGGADHSGPLGPKAFALLLVSVACGMLAAVVAQSLDPRIYNAADVEYVLRAPVLGDVADFGTVTREQSKEGLTKLAREIAQICAPGSLRRCVLTGTGHGAGVTTLAARLKETLESLDRPAMIVGATEAPSAEIGGNGSVHGVGPIEAADESGSGCDGLGKLIVTDTSPLTSSPDAEYLARFADCVVVVVESGVTTRVQLRETAECLNRLNVAVVRFVVNRVNRVPPGRGRRRPESELDVPAHFAAAVHRAIADPPKPSVSLASSTPGATGPVEPTPQVPKASTALTIVKRAPEIGDWAAPGIPPWLTDALRKLDAEAEQLTARAEAGQEGPRDLLPVRADSGAGVPAEPKHAAVTFERRSNGNAALRDDTGAMLFGMDLKLSQNADAMLAELQESASSSGAGANPGKEPSRLSGLRGMVSAAELRGLNHAWLETIGAEQVEVAQKPEEMRSEVITPKSAEDQVVVRQDSSVDCASTAESTAPDSQAIQSKPARRDRRVNDEVQILPSKRGQYRRKK